MGEHDRQRLGPVTLYEAAGPTSVFIEAEITPEGDLLISGQDVGEASDSVFGDRDYEYWLRVPRDQQERLILALLREVYEGNANVVSQMKALLETEGIPCTFETYM